VTILAITIPITGVLIVMATIIAAVDRQSQWVGVLLAALLLDVVLNIPLIWFFDGSAGNGAIGAALAAVVAETSQIVFGLRLLPKGMLNGDLRRLLLKVSAASGAMAGVMLLAGGLPGGIATVAGAGCLTYGLLLLAMKVIDPSTVRILLATWKDRDGLRASPAGLLPRAQIALSAEESRVQ
jgi:Na+-driven multidrug efflux pump